jgi:hypothetical protein
MDENTLSSLLHKAPDNLDPATSEIDLDEALKNGRRHQWRTRATISGTVVAAAAIATMVLVPGSSHPSKPAPLADSSSQSTVKVPAPVKSSAAAKPTTTPSAKTSATTVSFTFTASTDDVTAAQVLSQAAHSAQTAPDPDANVPLVNGWPKATYWYTASQLTSSSCPGQFEISQTWLGQSGSMMVANKTTGPISTNPTSSCDNPTANQTYPVGGYPDGIQIGGKIYTWSQWAALPTSPAALWPTIEADSNVGVAPGKGGIEFTFMTIANTLAEYPVSPAMREALFEVMEEVPNVTVSGHYTDSLGRTGTAITLKVAAAEDDTVVIDTADGQLLAQVYGLLPYTPAGCTTANGTNSHGAMCASDSVSTGSNEVTVYVSAGPADTEPRTNQPVPTLVLTSPTAQPTQGN